MLTAGTARRLRRSLHPLPYLQRFRQLSSGDAWQHGDALKDAHDPKHTTVSLEHPTFTVWGANTGIGKTLISAGLARAFAQEKVRRRYVVPPAM